nr:reverse transcriptase domain-containing protein [Tanacetum cinerariifolium]
MFEMVRAFIRGEVAIGSAKIGRPSQGDKGYVRLAWTKGPERARNWTPKEILAMESVSFQKPPPLIKSPKKQNLNKFCDYYRNRGHNTNDCYQLKKLEEAVASRKLAH